MFKIPDDIVSFFFDSIKEKGKYTININGNSAVIVPRIEEKYYKPSITIKDMKELKNSLENYVNSLNEFLVNNNNLLPHHDLSYLLNIMLFNMNATDSLDLASFIDRRSRFFKSNLLNEYDLPKKLVEIDGAKFYAQRILEVAGLETPFCMLFSMENKGNNYELPLIRYTFDGDKCYIFTVQMGMGRVCLSQDDTYKNTINKVNSGLKEYRNIPPNFVLSLALFLRILNEHNISEIIVPDFLFNRYRKYFKANGEARSNEILTRILNNYMNLLNRMELQIDGFEIISYPNDPDSFIRIKISKLSSKNEFLNEIVNRR